MRIPKLAAAALVAAGALLLPAASATAVTGGRTSTEHIITTLYAAPTAAAWTQVEDSAPTVNASIVDMCASDGTGSGCDGMPWDERPLAAWTTTIAALQDAGITPLVYIATDYGDQGGSTYFSLSEVEKEVSDAVGWYGQDIGFMFDEGATTCALESSYYLPLYKYVKSVTSNGTVEIDPGTVNSTMSCYMSASDVLQVFVGSESSFQAATFPSWMASYSSAKFAATISAGTSSGVGVDVTDAVSDGIGNVYVDNEAEPPTYATLPAFWSAEVADVAAAAKYNAGIVPVLYSYPSAADQQNEWASLYDAGGPAVQYTIANICDNGAPAGGGTADDNGPGCNNEPVDQVNTLWTQPQYGSASLLSELSQHSITPLGYVTASSCTTTCTPNTVAVVESQMQGYVTEYGINNFFIDVVPGDDATFACDLYDYAVSTLGASVVMLNPGTTYDISSSYMCGGPGHEILQLWENSSLTGFTMPSWTSSYPSDDFSVTLNDVGTESAMDSAQSSICADRVANFYINDDNSYQTMPNGYTPSGHATVPDYWMNNSTAESENVQGMFC
jgi:hypothetical protein